MGSGSRPKSMLVIGKLLAGLCSLASRPPINVGLVVLAGLALRFPLAFVHGYIADMHGSEELARNVVVSGLPHVYAPSLLDPDHGIYPPLYHCVLALVGFIYQRFFSPDWVHTPALDVLLKLVPILGDGLVGLTLYGLVRRLADARAALWAMLAFVFSPPVIYNSAYWGMFGDSLYMLCILLALLATHQEQVSLAWVAITLGALFKPQAIAFIPLIAWGTLRPVTLWRWVQAGIAGGLVLGAVWLPFILAGTLPEALGALRQTVGLFPVVSANAHNVWYFVTLGKCWFVSDAEPLLGLVSPRVIGLVAFGLAYVLGLSRLKEARGWPLLATAAFIAFAFFMLSTEMHENYIYPVVTLLAAVWPWSRRMTRFAIALTLTALVNMVLHDPPLQGSLEGPPYLTLIRLTVLNSGVNLLIFILWAGLLLRNPTVSSAMGAHFS